MSGNFPSGNLYEHGSGFGQRSAETISSAPPSARPHDTAAFREALKWAFAAAGPVIVEAIVDSRDYDAVVLKKDKP